MGNALMLEDRRNNNDGPQTYALTHGAENRLVQVSGTTAIFPDLEETRTFFIELDQKLPESAPHR